MRDPVIDQILARLDALERALASQTVKPSKPSKSKGSQEG